MKLYTAGKMSGLPDFNFPAFFAAAAQLREVGYEVECPAEPGQVEGWSWEDYMRRGLQQMLLCDGVAVLDGWHDSRGAKLEVQLAQTLGMPVRPVGEWVRDHGKYLDPGLF